MKKKINIMLAISSITGAGAELVVTNLCKYIDKNKFNVCCCHFKSRGERGDDLIKAGYDVIGLNEENNKSKYFSFIKLRNIVEEKRIDIINSHNCEALIETCLCKIITSRVKLVHTFHFGNYPHLEKKLYFAEKILCHIPNQLVAVGYNQQKLIEKFYHLREKRILTLYNGVEKIPTKISNLSKKLIPKTKSVIIGAISTFTEQKGLDKLLLIAKIIKEKGYDCMFVLAGDGPKRNDLEILHKKLGLEDTVKFLGWIKNAPYHILPSIDIFIQTSLWEAMSTAILEALSAGKPIIATNVGENYTILSNSEAGLISEPNDIKSMVVNIELLLNNKTLRHNLGRNARETFERNYTVENMAKSYELLFDKIYKRSNDSV